MPIKYRINKFDPDITKLNIFLRSVGKWGKSTLFRDVVLEKFGDPECGCILSMGPESGAKALDEILVVDIDSIEDFHDVVQAIINKEAPFEKVKMVSFDTADEWIPYLEEYTVKKYNSVERKRAVSQGDTPKMATSILNAYGGFGEGRKMAAKLGAKFVKELNDADVYVWNISHSKRKSRGIKGSSDEGEYMKLTSNLDGAYEEKFSQIFDLVLTGDIIFQDYEEEEVDSFGKKKIVRKANDEGERRLYFRDSPRVEAGGRLASKAVPVYMVFGDDAQDNAREFIKIVENGLEKSRRGNGKTAETKLSAKAADVEKPVAETAKPEPQKVAAPEVSEPELADDVLPFDDEDLTIEPIDLEALKEEVKKLFKASNDKAAKAKAKRMITVHGKVDDCPVDTLLEVKNLFI